MIRIRHIVPFLCLVYASAAKSPSGKPKEEGAKGDDKSEDLPALQLEAQAMKDIRFFQMLKGTWTSTESAPVPEGSLMINTWKEIDRYECRLILKDSFLEISGTITKDSGVKLLEYQLTYRQDKESPHQFLYTY
ncbi:hypothetical protein N9195_01455, partial [bacterium]|nr:hypothetical protein [bacterium]